MNFALSIPEPSRPVAQDAEALAQAALERIAQRAARIGVIGLGYVGLPLVPAIASSGYSVIGFDTDAKKVNMLKSGRSYLRHISDGTVQDLIDEGSFDATAMTERVAETDILLICVPTPLTRNREPDLTYIEATAEAIAPYLRPGQLVVLESTSFPGTTCGVVKPILEGYGLRSGEDFFLAYSPEREDPGNPDFKTVQIPKVIGGDGPLAREMAQHFYASVVSGTVPVSSVETAEAVKLTENIFRAVNIALVNELKLIYEAMGIDIWEVIEAAKTKPFGYMPFYPGPGLGGHCLPVDPFYLTWKAREFGVSTRFVELAGEINTQMPHHIVNKVAMAIDGRRGKGLRDARVLVLGVAYKKDVEDIRESPALCVMDLLEKRGARVDYHDPHVPALPATRQYPHLADRASVRLVPAALGQYDAVVICTDHADVDYRRVQRSAPLIIDTRNVYGPEARSQGKVLRA